MQSFLSIIPLLLWCAFILLSASGTAQAAIFCYQCHGTTSPPDYRPLDAQRRDPRTGGFPGSHRTHLGEGALPAVCVKCHPGSDSYTTDHQDGLIKVAANINQSPVAARYRNATSSFPQTTHPEFGTCTNVNCHFENETPVWGGAPLAAPEGCTTCHGTPPAGGSSGLAGSHARHGEYFAGTAGCSRCHSDHLNEPAPFAHATSGGRRPLSMQFHDPSGGRGGAYEGVLDDYRPKKVNKMLGACSATYCHSNGTSVATGAVAGNVSPAWGSGSASCNACHGYPPDYASGAPKANSHVNHSVTHPFGCNTCHVTTTADGAIISNTNSHVNKTYDLAPGTGTRFSYTYSATGGTCSAISCHSDATWGGNSSGGGTTCKSCHGHTKDYTYEPGKTCAGKGSVQSHATHTERDANHQRGPLLTCTACHDTRNFPSFRVGVDTNGDGKIDLSETTVCDNCHGKSGAVDGVNDPAIGAKANWKSGLYDGFTLKTGKERWCTGCHDNGQSSANLDGSGGMGANLSSYYVTGHGRSVAVECIHCHDPKKRHLDSQTSTKRFYGGLGVEIPLINRSYASFPLCFRCHDLTVTNFKNGSSDLHKLHVTNGNTGESGSCVGCHSVHGAPTGIPSKPYLRMLKPEFEVLTPMNPADPNSKLVSLTDSAKWNDPSLNKGLAYIPDGSNCVSCHAGAGVPDTVNGVGPSDGTGGANIWNNWFTRTFTPTTFSFNPDSDGDGIPDERDNCRYVYTPGQENRDGDQYGDACDPCPDDAFNDIDGDGICGNVDNCPTVYNPDQADSNHNGIGDACENLACTETDTPIWSAVLSPPGGYDRYTKSMAVDSEGNVYITGSSNYYSDGWLMFYSPNGDRFVQKNAPTDTGGSYNPYASNSKAVAVDASDNIYLAGNTYFNLDDDGHVNGSGNDTYVVKYDNRGNRLWGRMFTPGNGSYGNITGIAVDGAGNVFVGGFTGGNMDGNGNRGGSYDLFLMKYNANGTFAWIRQIGSSGMDSAAEMRSLAVDATDAVYFAATTYGYLGDVPGGTNAGSADIIVMKYDGNGTKQWARQIGTTGSDTAGAIATDAAGGIYVAGTTAGSLEPCVPVGTSSDAVLIKFDQTGNTVWTRQTGTAAGYDGATSVAVDGQNNVYVTGTIQGNKLLAFTSNGAEIFRRPLNLSLTAGGTSLAMNTPTDIVTDRQGNLYLTGALAKTAGYIRYGYLLKTSKKCNFVPPAIAAADKVSEWKFDEGTGTVAADALGRNQGTISGGAAWDPAGASGSALVCDGTNDRMVWNPAAGWPANNFAVEAMVKATTTHDAGDAEATTGVGGVTGQKYLFGANYLNAPDAGMGVSLGTNGISVFEHSGSYLPPLAVYTGTLGTGWNHVVVTYTDKTPRIYLNGTLVRTGLTSPRTNVYASTSICADTATPTPYGYFNGTVDEVTVYKRPLTATEVLQRCRDNRK